MPVPLSDTAGCDFDCITERETPHGYWWRYQHSDDEPRDTLLASIQGGRRRRRHRSPQARQNACVARATSGADAIYVFACDHPDASNAAINVMFEFTPEGQRVRRPAIRTAARH
jgi:hypothetical protein